MQDGTDALDTDAVHTPTIADPTMKCRTLLLTATSLLIASTASAQAGFPDPGATSIGTWYAVLIAVFAVLIGVGLVSSQRDQRDTHKRPESQGRSDTRPPHSGSTDARTLRRSKNEDQ
ncbi:hypothetical protein [Methylibium sp. Pch-M]|uniref:hypothetical protein n=1 Tax=Methylibium sp. Pch-M TaxID=2082386 RepID=UPI0010112EEC|nr:hypothetical protein [Methylibium sp. Pch-M]